jgi:hypothetical protein
MSKDARIAEKVAKWAEGDLVEAREFAKSAGPENQKLARQMARDAKRRRAKANRRAGRAFCREYDITQDYCP